MARECLAPKQEVNELAFEEEIEEVEEEYSSAESDESGNEDA